MKLKEMQEICDKAQSNKGCIDCKLFTPRLENGCLKKHRYEIIEKYKKYKEEKNDILAEKTMNDYQELERSILT